MANETDVERFVVELLRTLQNKPCSFGHERPTRLCASCGPFPDPVAALEAYKDSCTQELQKRIAELSAENLSIKGEWQDMYDAEAKAEAEVRELKAKLNTLRLGTCVGGWDGHEAEHEQTTLCVHWRPSK